MAKKEIVPQFFVKCNFTDADVSDLLERNCNKNLKDTAKGYKTQHMIFSCLFIVLLLISFIAIPVIIVALIFGAVAFWLGRCLSKKQKESVKELNFHDYSVTVSRYVSKYTDTGPGPGDENGFYTSVTMYFDRYANGQIIPDQYSYELLDVDYSKSVPLGTVLYAIKLNKANTALWAVINDGVVLDDSVKSHFIPPFDGFSFDMTPAQISSKLTEVYPESVISTRDAIRKIK